MDSIALSAPCRGFSLCIIIALAALISGCSSYSDLPAGTTKEVLGSPVIEQEPVTVPSLEDEKPPADYRIGSGDVLYINFYGQQDLGSPSASSESGDLKGSRVDGNGDIHLPLVGSVHLAGQSIGEAQQTLRETFAPYLKDPSVVVEVAEYRSQPVQLLGQFRKPGTYYMERPLTLLEGLSLAGGLSDIANLRSARLIRDKQTVPVDLYRLLQEGSQEQNVWLKSGDTIFVPDDRNQNVFVFGAVENPGRVPMPNGQLTLTQALASAGLDGARYNPEQVRIIRSLSPTRGQLIVVDMKKLIGGEALPFQLMVGDIIYMPRSAVGNWNQAIAEILPSLQLVSSVLQPFVQIKFLTDED